jgi:hypothetical protein
MCGYGVLRSILVGAAVTLRNVAFESLFGLKWGEYGRYSSPRKPSRGKFHYRWQPAPSSDPQIRIQDTPAIGNVNQLKVSGLPVGSREPSGGIVEEFTGALGGKKAHNHSRRSQ